MKTNEEKLAVIRAWLEKKPIEVSRIGKEWGQTSSPTWNWEEFDYRIKPDHIKIRTMSVAKAYVMPEGYIFWTLTEPAYPYKDSTRAPEFDLVANP